nr:hypothetical protein GCM10017611_46920 [Rhodococcus wratislaviensis]
MLVGGVVVEMEAELVAVERDGTIDVADGQHDHFECPVHDASSSVSVGSELLRIRWWRIGVVVAVVLPRTRGYQPRNRSGVTRTSVE